MIAAHRPGYKSLKAYPEVKKLKKLKYRPPSLFAVLVFAVLIIHGPDSRGKPQIESEKIQF